MHTAAFIGELQDFENLKLSYFSTCKWLIWSHEQMMFHLKQVSGNVAVK